MFVRLYRFPFSWITVCGLVMLLSSCAMVPVTTHRPEWIAHPKSDDSVYMYRVGHVSNRSRSEVARKSAYQDALDQISKSILSSVTVRGLDSKLTSSLNIRDAEIMPGCIHLEKSISGYQCWIQVSYPLSEKQKIIERIDLGERINSVWRRARSDMHSGAYENAKSKLTKLINDHEKAIGLTFEIDEAKFLLGDVYREQKDFLTARKWYENIEKLGVNEKWKRKAVEKLKRLPRPPRFWPMHDRFGGRKVALVCCRREGRVCRRSKVLSSVLMKDVREARLEGVDITSDLTAQDMENAFDRGDLDALLAAASMKHAGVVVAVLLDTDPKKRGLTTQKLGMEMPVMDTLVSFVVCGLPDGHVIYDGNFKEIAGSLSNTRLAKHAATILIQNYLVPKCPQF